MSDFIVFLTSALIIVAIAISLLTMPECAGGEVIVWGAGLPPFVCVKGHG